MSQANLPNITPTISISIDDAINLIISSIAMEELGLSHILNAEGEKLQYVLGTLPGVSAPAPTISDLLAINDSIRKTLKQTTNKDWVLSNKLEMVLDISPVGPTGTSGPTGPTGPTSPTGPSCVATCAPFLLGVGATLTCQPIINSGSTQYVSIQLPTGPTYAPVPPKGTVLLLTPNGITYSPGIPDPSVYPYCLP